MSNTRRGLCRALPTRACNQWVHATVVKLKSLLYRSARAGGDSVAKPPSDFGRDFGKLEGSVAVLQKLSFAIIGFLGVIVVGGLGLFVQMSGIRTDLTAQIADARLDLSQRVAKLEGGIAQIQSSQSSALTAISRIETRLAGSSPVAALALSPEDERTIRGFLKFDPKRAYKRIIAIGDIISDATLDEFPSDLISKVPILKGNRYTFDIKGRILIVSATSNRVRAIVFPTA